MPEIAILLDRIAEDESRHLIAGPASAEELDRVEAALGHALPGDLRRFLEQFGGGIFYDRHEIFGAQRVQLHDIEIVPSLVTMRERLASVLPGHFLAFHRTQKGVLHSFDLQQPGRIVAYPGNSTYDGFAQFLRDVMVPPD